jgi:GTP-binding protein Era
MSNNKLSGFVVIVGRPNSGKSSLINALLGSSESIVSDVPGTTLKSSRIVYEDAASQIVFVDTPGISKPRTKLGSHLNRNAREYFEEADIIVFTSPNNEKIGPGDRMILKELQKFQIPKIFLTTKSDLKNTHSVIARNEVTRQSPQSELDQFDQFLKVSVNRPISVSDFLTVVKSMLDKGPRFFEQAGIDEDIEFQIAELIRLEIIQRFNDELPHSVFVTINEMFFEGKVPKIYADIHIERSSQKPILLGKQGKTLNAISVAARKSIEQLLGKHIYLRLNITIDKNWQSSNKYLDQFGI